MRKKRTPSQMVAEQNAVRISYHEKVCAERMKTLFKAIDELKKDVREMRSDMNKWKGAGGIIILIGGVIGSIFYYFIGK
jgi:tetrahydromethanopterin S-methyltransferase subunit B|tara:strand:+ start:116 stop:352 length:237 start_codon:yes stop_codon:yes gene_type:complete